MVGQFISKTQADVLLICIDYKVNKAYLKYFKITISNYYLIFFIIITLIIFI